MKKSILFITLLLSVLALPTAAQKSFVKNSPRFSAPAKADEVKTLAMSHVVASITPQLLRLPTTATTIIS